MEKYLLSKDEYDLLKKLDLSEIEDGIVFYDDEHSFEVEDVDELLMIIDEAITLHGLSPDQESANEYGRKLYALYDSIYEQQHAVFV